MSWKNLEEFDRVFRDDRELMLHYRKRIPWAVRGWDQESTFEIARAYWIYKRTLSAESGSVVLSGPTDTYRTLKYGLLTGRPLQDPEVRPWLDQAKKKNMWGRESILHEAAWSSLANDSVVVGGVHGRKEFFLFPRRTREPRAATVVSFTWNGAARTPQGGRERFVFGPLEVVELSTTQLESRWAGFFNNDPEILWNSREGIPRVLAREIIGLQAYGYVPHFRENRLIFEPTARSSAASFQHYLAALEQAGI